ncbi:MAG: TolC family protein [Rhodothermaceae bacterium]
MKNNYLKSLVILLLLGTQISAQNYETKFNLNECLNYALKNSVMIKRSLLEIKSSDEKIREVRSNGLPQISAFAKVEHYPEIAEQYIPGEIFGNPGETIAVKFGKENMAVGGISVNQLIYDRGFWVGLKSAETSKEFYRLNKIKTREDVIYNVSAQFYQIRILDEQESVLSANIEKLNEVVRVSKLQFETDFIKQSDYEKAKISLSNIIVEKLDLEKRKIESLNNLKLLMGFPVEKELNLENNSAASFIITNELTNGESKKITDIRLLEKSKELKELEISSVNAGYLPSLSAYAKVNYQKSMDEFTPFSDDTKWNRSTTLGIQLSVPVFDSFNKSAKSEQAKLRLQIAEEELNQANNKVKADLKNASLLYQKNLLSVNTQKENAGLAEKVYSQEFLQYKEGITTMTDLLNAEASLREAKTSLNQSLLQLKLAELSLLKAKGLLNIILTSQEN